MSGHSHAATIKRDKDANDAKKGAAWSKISKLITIAVKTNGGMTNPAENPRLRIVLEKAREVNMPKDNINRAIERAVGKAGAGDLETITYEGYGPAGVACMVECITDNKNRAASEIKNIFEKNGGNLAEPGAAAHFFERKGMVVVKKNANPDEQMLSLIDLGADDVQDNQETFEVYVSPEKLMAFKDSLGEKFETSEAELVMKPKNKIELDAQSLIKVRKFSEMLRSHEDVQKFFCNASL